MTDIREIPRHSIGNAPLLPGYWRPVRHGGPDSPDWRIKFSCPNCGVEGGLDDHAIDADGLVSPSVQCPKDCGFHNHIRLLLWGDDHG